jgi:hypothetical protein
MSDLQPFRVSRFDEEYFEGRKKHLSTTGFSVVPCRVKPGAPIAYWLVQDRDRFNRWRNRKVETELQGVTWAWAAWEFKCGLRQEIQE